jgi:two-component system sensor kinase FixL
MQTILDFFAIHSLIPHGYCLNWKPALLWLHVASDVLIALAYYSIPLSLAYFAKHRKDVPYPKLFFLFALFIFACGTTHLLSALTIWIPIYWIDGYVKAFTALVSIVAAALMFRVIPHALQLPSAAQLQAEIEQRKLVEEALWHSETRFRTLYNSTSDAMILLNEQGFFDCNPACLSMFGYEDKQVFLTKHLADFSPAKQVCGGDSISLVNQHIVRALATGCHRFEWLHQRADTHIVFPAEVLFNAMDMDGKWMIHAVVRDITDRKIMEAELKRSNADLEQFAYAISHDMRQPLRMVTSYLTLLENDLVEQLNEEQQQFLNFALEGAQRMDDMILSLLDYSRVGHKKKSVYQVSSRTALDEALAFLQPELQASGGSLAVYGEWPDIMVNLDELTRLLQNLIGNALKYHEPDQPPRVEVSALIIGNTFKVAVRDHGIGIDEQHIDQLFKVFSRLQPRSRFEGTGVGLALCRKIAEYYGGTIGVESVGEGQGSVFWFALPIHAANVEPAS